MKKLRYLMTIAVAAVIMFVGCGKDDDNKNEFDCPFVGTWTSPANGGNFVMVFAAFPATFTITSPTGNVESGRYDWSFLNPNVATMKIENGGSGTFNVSISGNTLSFGSRTYTKI
jgi:hypothetical protein